MENRSALLVSERQTIVTSRIKDEQLDKQKRVKARKEGQISVTSLQTSLINGVNTTKL
jgi:hypothetical protein